MTLRSSPLSATHEAADATFTDFGGWEMPVEFDSIRTEHAAVRDAAGAFDVSHMGQVTVSGPDAEALVQRLTTNDVTDLDPGEGNYSAVTREDGVVRDDVVVYRLPDEVIDANVGDGAALDGDAGRPFEGEYLVVPNAGNDERATERWRDRTAAWDLDATVANRTDEYAMIAVQGPEAPEVLADATPLDLADLGRFDAVLGRVADAPALVARTGYTGEDGFEVICPWDAAEDVWSALECRPCGLGARDTLRIEMGFLLSGQDFHPEDEPRNPYEAGIGFAVDLDTEFVGRDALEGVDVEGPAERLVGLELIDRGVPRHGYAVTDPDGEALGHVTSGTMSPTLGEPIALAYLPAAYAEPGRTVRVVVRDEPKKARTVATPFLDR